MVNVNRVNFIKEQLLYFIGSIFILIAAFISFIRYYPFKKYHVFGWAFIFTILIFLYLKAKGYYAIGLYPIFISFGSVYLQYLLSTGWKRYLKPISVLVIVIAFLPIFKIAFPIEPPNITAQHSQLLKKLGLLRWEDGKDHILPQDYADMLGWSELARKTDSVFNSITNMENTLVLCDNYGQAGAINYYSTYRQIGAVSMNADYINWFPLNTMKIKNVILVQDTSDTDKERKREREFFTSVALCGKIENIYAREKGTAI